MDPQEYGGEEEQPATAEPAAAAGGGEEGLPPAVTAGEPDVSELWVGLNGVEQPVRVTDRALDSGEFCVMA